MSTQLLPMPFDIANSALVSSKFPTLAEDVYRNYASQASALTLPLDILDIHDAGSATRLALDHAVGASLYAILLRIARVISRAGNAGRDPRDVCISILAERLAEIDMPYPPILQILQATQNPCMLMGTLEELEQTYSALQEWGQDGIRWIIEARARCLAMNNGWNWDAPPHSLFPGMPAIDTDQATDYSARALEWLEQSATQPTDPSHLLEWHSSSTDESRSNSSYSSHESSPSPKSNSTDNSINFGYSQALVRYDPDFAAQQMACHACHGHGFIACEKRALSPIITHLDGQAGFHQLRMTAPPNSLVSSSGTSSSNSSTPSLVFQTDDAMDSDSDMADSC
ncbi:hypothetical protein HWV62_37829 [Athelia sp. TMB]|nr:hypothetical protein HWV62_37829 [Athelia sp. TMB]